MKLHFFWEEKWKKKEKNEKPTLTGFGLAADNST